MHLLSFIAPDDERNTWRRWSRSAGRWRSSRSASSGGRRPWSLLSAWRRLPLQALYYRSTAMQQAVDEVLRRQRFGAATFISSAWRALPELTERSVSCIVDLTDVISSEQTVDNSLSRRPALVYGIERITHRRAGEVAQRFEEVWLVSRPRPGSAGGGVP